jgi:hypothetical protein
MVRSKGSFASPSPSATGCTDGSDGPILFASTAHAGQINPLLSIAGELSRRGVPGLWFASTDNRRADIEGAAIGSPIHFVSCGINDRTKEPIEDPAFYAALALQGPMTTNSFLLAMRWDVRSGAIDSRVPADARPYRSRAAASHGHRHMYNQRARCGDDTANSFYSQLAVHAERVVDRTVAVGLSRSRFGFPAADPSVIYVGLGTLVRLSDIQITALIAAFKRLGSNHHILRKLPDSQQGLLPPRELLPTNLRIERGRARSATEIQT